MTIVADESLTTQEDASLLLGLRLHLLLVSPMSHLPPPSSYSASPR